MQSLWNDEEAKQFSESDLKLRVYTSRLLGRNPDLVLHGGGNTSVKVTQKNIFEEDEEILYVKGSGWNLETIEPAGFCPTKRSILQRLATLPELGDTEMTRELKAAATDPAAPAPSVEAILHAIIPFAFVDHTHADAVVALSNSEDGETVLRELYGPKVLILPYTMAGFVLAKQVFEATREIDWRRLEGIILLHHGVFTFDDDARKSYEKMIRLVSKAEQHLAQQGVFDRVAKGLYEPLPQDYDALAKMRRQASALFRHPMLVQWKRDAQHVGYSSLPRIEAIATRGPLTPDHVLYTKRIPAVLDDNPSPGLQAFESNYLDYFQRHSDGSLTCLDPAPRFAVWKQRGCVVFGPNPKHLEVISDILDHTLRAVQWSEARGSWKALSEREIFEIEYWELQQAKLKHDTARTPFEGKIAVISGAASGIGHACAEALCEKGAAVVALDINPVVTKHFCGSNRLGLVCDVTETASIHRAVQAAIGTFGGIDILVSNAGTFPASVNIEELSDELFEKTLDINLTGHLRLMRACIPYLRLGFDPTVIVMASKNVPAPGPGAGAYSASKAALTQLARVAALELAPDGIRVNILHPNAVFDTGVWTDEVLTKRASHYGLSVEEYKKSNLLKTTITSRDVARLVVAMAGPAFSKTTGVQVPIDGGNERVI